MSPAEPLHFRPDRGNVLAGIFIAAIFFIIVGWAPQYLFWILLFPLVFIFWVLRSATIVDDNGITIRYAFKGNKQFAWEEINGVGFKGSRSLVQTTAGEEHPLPGVTFNSLPKLAEASRGRIPDAITAAQEDADGKMEVVDRDGHRVLMTQEEYQAHLQQQKRDNPGTSH
ncbi:hypothetical protein C3B44_06595 [Corynebacterium yudongzhengii]|uniref:PH domain-containing protein n=1 Tax=Corynebacterium yudongzhengii TaxID=2080740 RepID=A0A2U1T9E9_9CORY|nr:PH domain-containing protein [Corynebacterium yudongzhengii]AWB82061.1 hypothetical protein C3B44_06595 [Corynebacterium yudongzhengii]PWC02565.1 PH domain-containing protein [Corynebacterium yudongzhengii]